MFNSEKLKMIFFFGGGGVGVGKLFYVYLAIIRITVYSK